MKTLCALIPLVLALATSACATKKFVLNHTGIVNDRVTQVENNAKEQTAALATKEQTDVSRLDERITTTNNQLATTTKTAEDARSSAAQANTAAGQAMQQAQTNSTQISDANSAISKVEADLKLQADLQAQTKNLDYTLSDTSNVTFSFDGSDLSDDAKANLDTIAKKATGAPRSVLEVVGFADKTGSEPYNTTLSQKRAEAVARYLVRQNVPLKDIAVIGLGEEQTPEQLAAEVQGFDPNAPASQRHSLERRVRIRLWVPSGTTTTSTASAGGGTN